MGCKESNQTNKTDKFLALNFSDAVFIMLINVKMPTIVGILTFMSRINLYSAELTFMSRINLYSAELSMKFFFITSGSDTWANGENSDEMFHNTAFHQGLHCLHQ